MLGPVEETLVEEEWLQTDYGQVERVAEMADVVGGCDVVTVEGGFGETVEIVDEEFDA